MTGEAIVLADGAAPRGRYPHARRGGDLLYLSGVSARRADNSIAGARTDDLGTPTLDIGRQTEAVIETVGTVLAAAGGSLADLVSITTYLVSMNDFGAYNVAYNRHFDERGPSRTTVAVHQLPHPHLLIEMQAVAYLPAASAHRGPGGGS